MRKYALLVLSVGALISFAIEGVFSQTSNESEIHIYIDASRSMRNNDRKYENACRAVSEIIDTENRRRFRFYVYAFYDDREDKKSNIVPIYTSYRKNGNVLRNCTSQQGNINEEDNREEEAIREVYFDYHRCRIRRNIDHKCVIITDMPGFADLNEGERVSGCIIINIGKNRLCERISCEERRAGNSADEIRHAISEYIGGE